MEADDDMIVLVVVDDDENANTSEKDFSASEPSEACLEVDNIIETAEKHGEYITIKLEPEDPECQYEYLEDGNTSETEINNLSVKEEPKEDSKEEEVAQDDDDDLDYVLVDDIIKAQRQRHRFTMLKPWQRRSFVAELREKYEELREDEDLLVKTLERIMSTMKPPDPPQDFYIMNGIMNECVFCGFLTDTIPAASRHFQEKHGQRYLVCYACGVDFRSTTNLYKHEKRCVAPDAEIVLRARAVFLGCKGKGRPFVAHNKLSTDRNNRNKIEIESPCYACKTCIAVKSMPLPSRFPCSMCSAVFITKSNLQSHENLHRGERPYRCHICPCAYTSHSALTRHTKKHSDAQYICDHCSRSFKIKPALVAHMDTHNPIRKFGCEECNRRFAQKSALILHVNRVHRNLPPPCACQICPKRYPRMSLLKAHMKRAHGMSIITRKMFFKSLPTMTELEIKQSKVVLKYDENEVLTLPPEIKPEPETTEEFNYELEYEEATKEMEEDVKPTQDILMEDLMQFMTQNNQDIAGTNVVYIENGDVVHSLNSNELVTKHDELILQVEAVVDGQIVVKQLSKDRNVGGIVGSLS